MKTSIDCIDYSFKYEALINWWNSNQYSSICILRLDSNKNYNKSDILKGMSKLKQQFNIDGLNEIYHFYDGPHYIIPISLLSEGLFSIYISKDFTKFGMACLNPNSLSMSFNKKKVSKIDTLNHILELR